MELIYLYIRKYENIFEDEEFNFSSNFVATFKNNHLMVEENKNAINQYYGNNVNSVVMFLGKNGMGKSALLDILGMTRDDRINDTYERKDKHRTTKSSYFMLYHLYDNYFGFEFVDDSFLNGEQKISNIDMQYEKVESALYKLPIGNIFKLEKGVFFYCDNIMLQWLKKKDYKNKVEYAYITSDRYNSRITNKYRKYGEDYMFERRYYLEENNYEYLYKYFVYLKEINNELLQEKSIAIKNSIEVDVHFRNIEKEIEDYLEDRKKELDKLFDLKSKIQIQMEEKILGLKQKNDTRCMKEIFIYTFCAEAIEYYFLEQLVGWSENEGLKININTPIPVAEDIEYEIENLLDEEKEDVENGLMDIMNFQNEYALLLYQIKKNSDMNGNINLRNVLEYTLNRVENAARSTIDISDKEAVLKIITLLEELPQYYFESRRTIRVKCDIEKTDEKIIELLRWYDYYYKTRNYDDKSNNIFRLLLIEMPKMSEGQRVFLDIVSKCVSAIYMLEPGDSLILLIDEPDRALHPELARRFLDALLDNINKCMDRKIQLVLSSHSPFIVTDILPENVYAIDMKDGERRIRNNSDTYATNIYYLLMDSFMLENTFGEHSYKQIKYIAELLNGEKEIESEKLEQIKRIIDRIGEKTLKRKLLHLYEKRDNSKSKLVDKLLCETDENKIRKIKEILDEND